MTRLACALLLLTGCGVAATDVPTLSAAVGMKRLGPAVASRHASVKARRRTLHQTSRSLHRRPEPVVAQLPPNWQALANCESSGNPHAVDPSGHYFGLYQFDVQTWRSIGGTGLPSDASPAEQTARAELLYASRGSAPWPVCGSNL